LNTQTNSDKQHLSLGEKTLFASCYYLFFVTGGFALLVGAIIPYMRETYNLSYQITGLLISFHAFGSLISSFVGGIIPVYLGRKISILLLSSAAVIGFILMTLTGNPFFLLLAFFLTGINKGAISNFGNTIVNDIATGKAWAQNLLHSMFAIGAFVSPFVALFFTHGNTHGWVYAVLIWAFLCFTELIVLTRLKIPNNFPMHKKSRKMNLGFLKNKYYLTACLILFFYAAAEQSINGFLVTYFKDSGIMSGTFAQIMAGLLWVVILIGRLTNAYISNFIEKSKLLLINGIGYLIFFVVLLSSKSLVPAAIGIIGVGFCMASLYPTTISGVGLILKEYPLALSFTLAFPGIGAIVMPTIIGAVADNVGIIGGMSIVVIAVIFTLALIIYNAYIHRNVVTM
jgi:FHS family glucose/mannose:H+ symporter-like MFS transporter